MCLASFRYWAICLYQYLRFTFSNQSFQIANPPQLVPKKTIKWYLASLIFLAAGFGNAFGQEIQVFSDTASSNLTAPLLINNLNITKNPGGDVTLSVWASGDLGSPASEFFDVQSENGSNIGQWALARECTAYDSLNYVVPRDSFIAWAADGVVQVNCVGSPGVNVCAPTLSTYVVAHYIPTTSQNDAGITEINSGLDKICGGSQPVFAQAANFGLNQITSLTLNWSVNGVLQTSAGISGTLDTIGGAGNNKENVNLGNYNFVPGNSYVIRVWSSLPNGVADTVNFNDTLSVTVRSGMGGVYTIGGVSPDYASFTAAVNDLHAKGVCDSVIFRVRSNTYIEQVRIGEIFGTASDAWVIFESESGDSSDVMLTFNSTLFNEDYTLRLDSTSFIHFRRMTIRAENASYGRTVEVQGTASSVRFSNVRFLSLSTPSTTTYRTLVFYPTSNNYPENHRYENCLFENGSIGIDYYSVDASEGPELLNNHFLNQYYIAIDMTRGDNARVENNRIHTNSPYTAFYGILMQNGQQSARLVGNSITGIIGGYGIYLGQSADMATPGLIANNYVSMGGSIYTCRAIFLQSCTYYNVFYNTINIFGNNNGSSYGLYVSSGSNNRVLNNNVATDECRAYYVGSGFNVLQSDYNNFFANQSNLGYWAGDYFSLSELQSRSGMDSNSFNLDPFFVADTSFQTGQTSLNASAKALPEVTDDIEGDIRSLTTPDIGADEFTPPSVDAGVIGFIRPQIPFSPGSYAVKAVLKNYGNDPLTSADINWELNGVAQSTVSWTGSVASGDTVHVTLSSVNFMALTTYSLLGYSANPNASVDPIAANDTALEMNIRAGLGGTYTLGGVSPDFMSFGDAALWLNNAGVYDSVIINVRAGTYNEQFILRSIPGASAVNTVCVQSESGDSSDTKLSYSPGPADNYVIALNGTRWLRLKRLGVEVPSSFYQHTINLDSNASDNRFENLYLLGNNLSSSSTVSRALVYATATYASSNNTFVGCQMSMGSYAIYWYNNSVSTDALEILSCRMTNQNYRPIYIRGINNLKFNYNQVTNDLGPLTTAYQSAFFQTIRDGEIMGNWFINGVQTYGVALSDVDGINDRFVVANNFMQSAGTGSPNYYSLYLTSCNSLDVVYNNLNSYCDDAGSMVLNYQFNSDVLVQNNILQHDGGGYAFSSSSTFNSLLKSDHNDLYTSGAYLGRWGSTNIADLATWVATTMLDSNSISEDAQFIDTNDLHVAASGLNAAAKPYAGVTMDIDGEARDVSTPDIGADEFGLAADDAGVVNLDSPTTPFNPGSNNVAVSLLNNGAATLTSVTFNWEVNGVAQTPFAWTGSLASGGVLANVSIGNFNFMVDSIYCVKIWTSMPNGNSDAQALNDTLEKCRLYPALSGIYTIGGSNPDFPDFSSAATALHRGGVSGWVNFIVRDSTYGERLVLRSIPGVSATDSVAFIGENDTASLVTINASNNSIDNFVVALNGADHVSFRDIDIVSNTPVVNSYQTCVVLDSSANHNRFERCEIRTASTNNTTSSIATLVLFENGFNNHHNRFVSCHFERGSYGIYLRGLSLSQQDTGNYIMNSVFLDQQYRAIYGVYQSGLVFSMNTITSVSYTTSYIGTYLDNCRDVLFDGNRYLNLDYRAGYFYDVSGSSPASPSVISNNFVHIIGTGAGYGFYIYYSTDLLLAHNSFNVQNTNSATAPLQLPYNFSLSSYNNIFQNLGGGPALRRTSSVTLVASDHNNYYTTGINLVLDWNTNYADLASFVAGAGIDSNSLSVNPQYADSTDLHASSVSLDGAGMPLPQVGFDIDKEPRNPTNPDIGADEFATNSDDAALVAVQNPATPFPAGNNSVQVQLLNNGADTLNSLNLYFSINGGTPSLYNWTGALPPGATEDFVTLGSFNFMPGMGYVIKAWSELPNGNTDILPQNDTAITDSLYPALAGVYTIGGTTPDFNDFSSAAQALNRGGVVGPVQFMVRDGVYTEQVVIDAIPGTSATDSVCFMAETGDSASVTLSHNASAGQRYTLLLNGTAHISFIGIGFTGTSASYGDVVTIQNGTMHTAFRQCWFNRGTISSGIGLYINNNIPQNSYTLIDHCQFTGGTYGLYEQGNTTQAMGLWVGNSRMNEQTLYGILISDYSAPVIYRNQVRSSIGRLSSSYIGIYLLSITDSMRIVGNFVYAPNWGDGIRVSGFNGSAGRGLIANNFISCGDSASSTSDALFLSSCQYLDVFYNSVRQASGFNGSEAALFSGNSEMNIKNNIFANLGAGVAVWSASSNFNVVSDFNDIYGLGANLTYYQNTNYTDLAAWQAATGWDANSVSANPDFVGPLDLHMRQPLLDSAAMVLAEVDDDYDGQMRDLVKPDIGADEVIFFPDDLKLQALLSPLNECGLSDTSSVTVEVFNAGNADQTGFDISIVIDGDTLVENVGAQIFPSRQATPYTFSGRFDLSAYKAYAVKSWTNLAGDIYRDNDTLITTITNFPPPVTSITADTAVCNGTIVNLVASGGVSYLWSNSLTGASIFVAPTFTTTYWVRVTDANGCVAYDSTTVTVSDSANETFLTAYTCDTAMVGVETVTLTNQGGCDSLVTTTWIFVPASYDTLPAVSICGNDSSLIFGAYRQMAGFYFDTLAGFRGCDSILVQELRIDSAYQYFLPNASVCDGDSVLIFGNWQRAAGLYSTTLQAANGCDSIVSQALVIKLKNATSDTSRICQGDSILLAGAWRTAAGAYPESFTNTAGCDSTITHYVEILPVYQISQVASICEGDSIWLAGSYQKLSGVYTDSLMSVSSCDSIVTTTLHVNPRYAVNDTLYVLQGDSVLVNGTWLSMAGNYTDTLSSASACDSIVTTTIVLTSPARSLSFSMNGNFTTSLITPLQGTPYTSFDFEVVYTDSSGALPPFGFPRIILDYEGNGFYTNANDRLVLLQEADVNDQDASDGKLYVGTVNALPLGKNWQVLAQVIVNGEQIQLGPFDHPDVLVEPDLQIFANDITFSNNNPGVSSPLTISAKVTNVSDLAAQNFVVHLENQNDTAAVYPDITVANLGPNSSTTVQWNITTPPDPSWNPMQVWVDYTDVIMETNELDNNAVRPFVNGSYNVPGDIVVVASANPGNSCSGIGKSVTLTGFAYYINTAVQLADSSVAGAEVNFSNNGANYSTITNSNGYFSLTVPAPLVANQYVISGTVTDFTLTGNFTTTYGIIDCPCTLPDLRTIASPRTTTIFQGDSVSGFFNIMNVGCVSAPANLLSINQNGGSPTVSGTTIPTLGVGDTFNYYVNNIVFNTPGVYSICATADGGYTVQESNEYNNTDCMIIRVLAPTVDLYPLSGPGGLSYVCNNQAAPYILVANGGTVASGPFVTKVRIYKDGLLQDSAYHSFTGLAARSNGGFTIPYSYSGIGTYSFEVIVDTNVATGGIQVEDNETNNTATYSRTLIVCKPDLVISQCRNLNVSPVDPAYPGMVTYEASVRNAGNATAFAPIDVDFEVMPGVVHTTQIMTDLAPNQSIAVSVNVPSVAPATANLRAYADPQNLIEEFNEANNIQQDSLCWEFAPVEPCGGGFWRNDYRINTLVNVSVAMRTLHLYEASSVGMKFEVSGPGILGTQDLGTVPVADVIKDCGCPRVVSLPNGFIFGQPGTYTFTFTVDPDNIYTECNEGNNVLTVDVDAFAAPDMRILSQFINPSKLNPDIGEAVTFDITYENIGVANINDQMELKVLVDDIPLDSINPVPGLYTNDNITFSIPASWFSNVPGAHVIRAIIDGDNDVSEINELNNEATRAIVVGEAANLYFAYFMASNSSPAIGDSIDIEFIIGNNGDVDATADIRVSYVNDLLDTISIGTIPVGVLKQDSTGMLSIPWLVADNNTTLVGEIINTNTLEWSYDDNKAYDSLGVFSVSISGAASCFSEANGWLKATPSGGVAPYNYAWSNGASGDSISGGSGNYYVDITDASGVSVRAFGNIGIIPGSLTELPVQQLCQGDSVMIFGQWRSQAGIYYDTLSAVSGCDSIIKQQLNVIPSFQTMEITYACGGLPNQMGIQIDSLTAVNGCDSIHVTYILYQPPSGGQVNLALCAGDSIMIAGNYVNTAGVYYDTLQTASGCDSILTVNLSVNNPDFTLLPAVNVCAGDSIMIFGQWRSMPGTYLDTLTNAVGCDSVLSVDLNLINPGSAMLPVQEICEGDSVMIFGIWRKMTGTYYDTLTGASGCDSLVMAEVQVNPIYTMFSNPFICQGDSLFVGGGWQTTSGTYFDTLQSNTGCDSILATYLDVGSGVLYAVPASICSGDSILLAGAWQTTAGVYYDTISVQGGCDSVRMTTLSVQPNYLTSVPLSICDGDSILIGGTWRTMAGSYQTVYSTASGCDSTVITQLSVLPVAETRDTISICAGDSAFINGQWQHVPGDYFSNLQSANSCDSTHVTTLEYRTTGCNVDCNGVIGGSAYLDSCGVCVGGNTGKQPCGQGCVSLEVVSFTLVDASTGMDVGTLYDGDTIDKRQIPNFSIRANTCGDSVAPGQIECITFDNGLVAGNIPTTVVTSLGSGPIGVYGYNPGFPGTNAAMVFNSNSPTGGDFDLGTPHIDFGGPGVGAGGASGSPWQNNLALNNLLMVSQDMDSTDPNDLRGMGILEFDFAAVGPVIVHSLTIVDIEGKEGPPMVRFYDMAGNLFNTISLNTVGDNGVANINFGPVAGVYKMSVHFGGSGALDNLCIETSQTNGNGGLQLPGVPVGSVLFDVNGSLLTRENLPPYAIMGGTKTTYNPWNPAAGLYQVKATPYQLKNGKGIAGIAEIVNLVIVDGTTVPDCNGDVGGSAFIDSCGVCAGGNTGIAPCMPACQALEVTSFKLVSAVNGSLIGQLNDGDTIDRAALGPFSIRAETCNGTPVGSVVFNLNGSLARKENVIPYDINGGTVSMPNAWMAPLGTHLLVATPYSGSNGNGSAGIAETVNFTVIESANPRAGGSDAGQPDDVAQSIDGASAVTGSMHQVEDAERLLMKVYPNPSSGQVYVDLKNLHTDQEELELMDVTGKVLMKLRDAARVEENLVRYELDLSELPDGIYLLRLHAEGLQINQRIVKR